MSTGAVKRVDRKELLEQYPRLARNDVAMIVSADLEGLLCAAMLHHHLGWTLAGLDDGVQGWIDPAVDFDGVVGVHLKNHRRLSGISCRGEPSPGTLNPNWVNDGGRRLGHFPLSTPLFLLWLHDIPVRRELVARLLLLSAGDTWQSSVADPDRVDRWLSELPGYDWDWLLANIGTDTLERRLHDQLRTPLKRLLAVDPDDQLDSIVINPDWDSDVIMNYFAFVGTWLKWSPPALPSLEPIDWESSPAVGNPAA